MKKLKTYLVFFLIFLINTVKSQEIRHVITPNIIIGNSEKNSFSVEAVINFKTEPYINVSYLITEKIAVFGSYNFISWKNRRILLLKSLFGNPGYDFVENNNQGYRFGIGILDVFKLRKFKNTEILLGFENQNLKIKEYEPDEIDDFVFINQDYNTIFLQLNVIKKMKNEKYRLGYSLKFSYFKLNSLENKNSNQDGFEMFTLSKNDLFISSFSAFTYYKIHKTKPYFIKFQFDASGALEDFEMNVNREGFWGYSVNLGFIIRLGKN